jgi:hypothetical protein
VILTRSSYDRAFRKLTFTQRTRVNTAVARLESVFGRPHLHAGIGLRAFGSFFECRAGLDLRILFVAHQGDLILVTTGTHEHVARFVRDHS